MHVQSGALHAWPKSFDLAAWPNIFKYIYLWCLKNILCPATKERCNPQPPQPPTTPHNPPTILTHPCWEDCHHPHQPVHHHVSVLRRTSHFTPSAPKKLFCLQCGKRNAINNPNNHHFYGWDENNPHMVVVYGSQAFPCYPQTRPCFFRQIPQSGNPAKVQVTPGMEQRECHAVFCGRHNWGYGTVMAQYFSSECQNS